MRKRAATFKLQFITSRFNNIYYKGYNGQIKKYIAYLIIIYQGFYQTKYSTKLIHMMVYMKWFWKSNLK